MRVSGQGYAGAPGQGRLSPLQRGGATFAPDPGAAEAAVPVAKAGQTGAASSLSSLAALIALQNEPLSAESSGERRRKAAARGFGLLDALGRFRLGLLAGGIDESALSSLRQGLDEAQKGADEPELDRILQAIDTRAAVELAKLGR
jgi:hypothetical protein